MAYKKIISVRKIKQSLLEQLEKNGSKAPFYEALVEDYIRFEEMERAANQDIEENGTVYKATSAQGKEYDKENPNIKAVITYSKQKLAILKQLGLSMETVNTEDENDTNWL